MNQKVKDKNKDNNNNNSSNSLVAGQWPLFVNLFVQRLYSSQEK